jgi:two-component sensor histidine kinase
VIYPSNAEQYQYRILLNGKTVILPWTNITSFTDSNFELNNSKKGMAFLGGYKTDWDNYLTVELKQQQADTIIADAVVYWKQVSPLLLNVYTTDELNSFLARLKKPYDFSVSKDELNKWRMQYKPEEINPANGLPKKLLLDAKEDNIIFYLEGNIYKKEALEYELIKDGAVDSQWKPNDFDNNFIWLKNLQPGDYELKMRFRSQRHNITGYPFCIKRQWYQTTSFKMGVAGLLALILLLIFRLVKQQQKTALEKNRKEKLNLELKALRSQLNPHFVFNALNSIQGLMNKNEPDAANHYLAEFSTLLRESLKNKDAEFVPLQKELKILETYIKLEQLRFQFQYMVKVADNLATNDIEIPSLLIQPLVENAIKHGAGPKNENGFLQVQFSASDKNLLIDISDNGTGFDTTQANNGFGLNLVKERVRVLNDSFNGQKIQLLFDSNKTSSTVVHLIFENWL